MDVQRTMEFILEQQARTAAHLEGVAAEQKALATEQKGLATEQKKLASQQAKTEKRVDSLAKIVQTGMKMMLAREKRVDERIQALVDSQLRLDQRMDRFIENFNKHRPNGSGRKH
ncbi:MAG: hypothetical protein FJW20_14375 [Acidimicrobiia bacterium]|nr:hypothetical protein [Acidimicrobiia bacterium]